MLENLYYYKATVVSVYDGDSITCNISLGFGFFYNKIKLRLEGIDSPELRGDTLEAARLSRDYLKSLILDKEVIVLTSKDLKGKYGRYIAKIYIEQDGEFSCVNDMLVENGYAQYKEY